MFLALNKLLFSLNPQQATLPAVKTSIALFEKKAAKIQTPSTALQNSNKAQAPLQTWMLR